MCGESNLLRTTAVGQPQPDPQLIPPLLLPSTAPAKRVRTSPNPAFEQVLLFAGLLLRALCVLRETSHHVGKLLRSHGRSLVRLLFAFCSLLSALFSLR